MCIIVWKPDGIKLFDKTIETCFANNPDGAGFTYVENGELHTSKGFFTVGAFTEAYRPHETKPALLHFRIRTHGDYSPDNCHPFEVQNGVVFAHNGVISKMPLDEVQSDSMQFNDLVLKKLATVYGPEVLFDPLILNMMEGWIGFSKLVFLAKTGKVAIVGEKLGEWTSGCWFSNPGWKIAYTKYVPPKNSYKYEPDATRWSEEAQCYVKDFSKKKKHKSQAQLRLPSPVSLVTRYDYRNGEDFPELPKHPLPLTITPHTGSGATYRPLQINDYLRMNSNYRGAERGWLGKAMGFYADGTVELYFPLHKRTMRVDVAMIDPVTPLVIAPTEKEAEKELWLANQP